MAVFLVSMAPSSQELEPPGNPGRFSSRLAGEYRHVMPGIVDSLAAAEMAAMFADNRAVLADHDAIGVGLDLDRPADGTRGDRILVVVDRTRQVFETDAWVA